jgi:hypothetical protein
VCLLLTAEAALSLPSVGSLDFVWLICQTAQSGAEITYRLNCSLHQRF